MADPDIRRMGKKHKKHKKEYSQYHNIRLPGKFVFIKLLGLRELTVLMRINWNNNRVGFLPERVPMPETEPVNEMKVVLKLPRPMENHNGKLRFAPSSITQHQHRHGHGDVHHSRPSWGSSLTIPPRELIVSIPFTALCQQEEEEEPIEPEAEPMAAITEHEGEQHHHSSSSHHKHKKHKKHHKIKKHHHHHRDSAPQEEVRGQFGGAETGLYPPVAIAIKHEPSSALHNVVQVAPIGGTTKTVAPLKIQVPKPSPPSADASSRTLSKHKTHSHSHAHHEESSMLVAERRGQPPPGALPSGKHMHTTTTTHKHHHHKHKEKRHHHQRSSGYQGDEHVMDYHGNEDVIGGGDDDDDDFNEQGQAVVMRITPPTRPPGGKPTAFMKTVEEKKKFTFTSDEYSPISGTSEKVQTSSHEGHRHHKKKKKKHHKHSKHSVSQSEPEVSPPVARLSTGTVSEASQLVPGRQLTTATPLSTGGGSRSTTITAQAHAHPVAIPQDVAVINRETALTTRSPSKEGKKLIHEDNLSVVSHSSFRETRRLSSQDSGSGSSSRLPLRKLSDDKRTPKKLEAQSPDVVQPPPPKRPRVDDEKPPLPPSLKFDISQTKELDFEPRDTLSPVSTGAQFDPLSLRHQTSYGSSDSVASTPVTVARPLVLGEARRSSIGAATGGGGGGERTQHQSTGAAMAPSPPVLQNPAEMKTAQGRPHSEFFNFTCYFWNGSGVSRLRFP
jgi:hypothetical protein